jgi:hypothetical protein
MVPYLSQNLSPQPSPKPSRHRPLFSVQQLESRTLLSVSQFYVGAISTPVASGVQYAADTKIAAGPNGDVVVTGLFGGAVNFNPRGSKPYILTADGYTDVFIAEYDAGGGLIWANRFGGTNGSFPAMEGQAVDIDTDPSRAGNWVNSLDTEPQDLGEYVNGLAVDSAGNVYITGGTRGVDTYGGPSSNPQDEPVLVNVDVKYYQIYLIKLDPRGNPVWADTMGGQFQNVARSIALDSAGNPYISGMFSRTANFNPQAKTTAEQVILSTPGRTGAFVAKYTSNGALVWADATAVGDETDAERRVYANSIAIDANDNVYVGGVFAGQCDFDPGGSGDVITSMGKTDEFIQKFSPTGTPEWVQDIGGSNAYSGGMAIALSPGGTRIYAAGYIQDTAQIGSGPNAPTFTTASSGGSPDYTDLLITAMSTANGNLSWARQISNSSWKTIGQMTTDAQGNLYITGGFYYSLTFGTGANKVTLTSPATGDNYNDNNDGSRSSAYSVYVVKMTSAAQVVYADQIGAAGDCFGVGLAIEPDDDLLVAGRFKGTVNFDPTGQTLRRLRGQGASSGFAIRLNPDGTLG